VGSFPCRWLGLIMGEEMKSNRSMKLRKASLGAIGLVATLTCALTAGMSAQAQTTDLGPADVFASKTYFSNPHFKSATGSAYIQTTGGASTSGGTACGANLYTGLRTNAGTSGELTQFPLSPLSTSVAYRNVAAPPGSYYTFSSGYYYVNAQDAGAASSCVISWSGQLSW